MGSDRIDQLRCVGWSDRPVLGGLAATWGTVQLSARSSPHSAVDLRGLLLTDRVPVNQYGHQETMRSRPRLRVRRRASIELLDPERIGVSLSDEFQLHPEQSTSAIIAHRPEAKYFAAR